MGMGWVVSSAFYEYCTVTPWFVVERTVSRVIGSSVCMTRCRLRDDCSCAEMFVWKASFLVSSNHRNNIVKEED